MNETALTFELVEPNDAQVTVLYDLLVKRKYSISHKSNPSYEQHKDFVYNHPYRRWYLVRCADYYIGTAYVQNDNSVGINFIEDCYDDNLSPVLGFIRQNLEPLEAKPSVRYGDFFINVAARNLKMRDCLKKLVYRESQVTYVMRDGLLAEES